MRGFALAIALLLISCGGARSQEPQPPPPAPGSAADSGEGEKMTLTGKLERTVEAGGWVLQTGSRTYLLIFDRELENEDWFKAGAKVKVSGEESADTITIFMQGTPFKVEKMEPAP